MDKKELSFEELEKLVFSKKANSFQKMKYAELLTKNTEEELKAEKETRIEKVFDLMEELEISKQDMLDKLKVPPVLIFEWDNNKRYQGERGKLPSWCADMKSQLKKEEAIKFVINGNEKGKEFVNNLYKP